MRWRGAFFEIRQRRINRLRPLPPCLSVDAASAPQLELDLSRARSAPNPRRFFQ